MTMSLIQVRLPSGLVSEIDEIVDKGHYSNKSDVIRDAIRRFILHKQVGSVKNRGDSVKQVRRIRKILSKERFDIKKLNKL